MRQNLEQTVITYDNLPLTGTGLVCSQSTNPFGSVELGLALSYLACFYQEADWLSNPWKIETEMLPTQSMESGTNVISGLVPLSCWEASGLSVKWTLMWRCEVSPSCKENSKQTPSQALTSAATKGQRTKTRSHFVIHGERNRVEKNRQFVFSPARLRAAEEWPPPLLSGSRLFVPEGATIFISPRILCAWAHLDAG